VDDIIDSHVLFSNCSLYGLYKTISCISSVDFEVLNKDKFSRKWTKQDYLIIALAIVFVLNIFKIFEHMIFFILQIQK